MPKYRVDYRNAESLMLHSSVTLTAPDEETALKWSEQQVKEESGVGTSIDGAQVTTRLPRFTVSCTETQ